MSDENTESAKISADEDVTAEENRLYAAVDALMISVTAYLNLHFAERAQANGHARMVQERTGASVMPEEQMDAVQSMAYQAVLGSCHELLHAHDAWMDTLEDTEGEVNDMLDEFFEQGRNN